jgi:fatty-acyl-CoA synthase
MMKEYWNASYRTADAIRDGWYFTGDAGYVDADGFFYFVDRVDNMIISGGENIYPAAIEHVIYQHEAVSEVAVVGTDHDQWGESVTAFVVPNGDVTVEELDRQCWGSNELADFKRPRRYVFRESLPTNQSGKIQRYKLRERAASGNYRYQSPDS